MSLRKLSGAAAAGSREAYATTSERASVAASGAGSSSASAGGVGNTSASGPGMSKAYSSHLAVQSDATKYRGKYKELKKKVRQIEAENDKLHFKTLRIKRNIQRMRLERAILYERLEAELNTNEQLMGETQANNAEAAAPRAPPPKSTSAAPVVAPPIVPSQSRSSQGYNASPVQVTPTGSGSGGARTRRTMDYSPSPEEDDDRSAAMSSKTTPIIASNGAGSAATETNGSAGKRASGPSDASSRPSMKITLKRSSNAANGS